MTPVENRSGGEDMVENAARERITAVYFTAAAALMYYFIDQALYIPVGITFRHIFALLLIFSAFIHFLIRPNIARAAVAVKSGLVMGTPTFVMIIVSLLIWCVERTDVDLISRGLSYYLFYMNLISAALAAGALLYVFGEKGLWYNLAAILIANIMMLVTIMMKYGVAAYFNELWMLIKTFARETGSVILLAEIHELAFCTGAYMVYMLLKPRRGVLFWGLFGLTAFCFLSAFKRIAMVAIAAALVVGWLMRWLEKRGRGRLVAKLITGSMLLIVVLLVLYILAVKLGLFELLEKAGVDTSGRADIYKRVGVYYEFSPLYMGRGMGFLTYQLNEITTIGVGAVHNDFLQFYIDLGFFGYILWLLSMTLLRTGYFGRGKQVKNQIVAYTVLLYMILTSTTDNTLNYQLFNTVTAMIIMGHGFDGRVREEEEKLFGYISPENSPRESRLL